MVGVQMFGELLLFFESKWRYLLWPFSVEASLWNVFINLGIRVGSMWAVGCGSLETSPFSYDQVLLKVTVIGLQQETAQ